MQFSTGTHSGKQANDDGCIGGFWPTTARMRPLGSDTRVRHGSVSVCRHIRHVRHSSAGTIKIVGTTGTFRTLAPDDGFEEVDFSSVISVIHWMGATEMSGTLLFKDIQLVRRPLRNERPYPDKLPDKTIRGHDVRDLWTYSITN